MKNLKFFLALLIFSQFFQSGCSRTKPDASLSITLQPDHNPGEWLLVKSGQKIFADTRASDLAAASWTMAGFPVHIYGAVKFDFSLLPRGASVVSARLSLFSNPTPATGDRTHANFGKNNSLAVQRITSRWPASQDTLTIPETDTLKAITIPASAGSGDDLLEIDVTSLVKDMQRYGNYGFFIRMQTEGLYRSRIFCSSKHEIVERHPRLMIVYKM